jgi:hypothetical protein
MNDNLPREIAIGVMAGLWGFCITWIPIYCIFFESKFLRGMALSLLMTASH